MTGLFGQIADRIEGRSWPSEVIAAFEVVRVEHAHQATCPACTRDTQLAELLAQAFAEGWRGEGSQDIANAIVLLADEYRRPEFQRRCERWSYATLPGGPVVAPTVR